MNRTENQDAMRALGEQLADAVGYIVEGDESDFDSDAVVEHHQIAITRLAARLAAIPIEAAISTAVLANFIEVRDLAVETIARVPPGRVSDLLLSPEVGELLAVCGGANNRPLVNLLVSADPEAVACHLWTAGDAAGWGTRGSEPQAADIAWIVRDAVTVVPADGEARRVYWRVLARLIWGMVEVDWGGEALVTLYGQPVEVVRRHVEAYRVAHGRCREGDESSPLRVE